MDDAPATRDELFTDVRFTDLDLHEGVQRAIDEHNLQLAKAPDHIPTLYALARLRLDQGDTIRAAACYEKILALDPRAAEAALELGTIRQDAGDMEGAIALYRSVSAATDEARLATSAVEAKARASRAVTGEATTGAFLEAGASSPDVSPAPNAMSTPDDLLTEAYATSAKPILGVASDAQTLTFAALFAGRELVVRDVPAEEAPDRLVELIRSRGDWIDPPSRD